MNWNSGELRGTGRTTKQMASAPIGTIFICTPASAPDFREKAKLYSNIIKVVAQDRLDEIRGYSRCIILVDHAVTLTDDQRAIIHSVIR